MLTVGEILYRARKQKGLSIEQVEKETRIRKKYIQAIEKNDWETFTSRVYITGVIKSYASYLDLIPENVLAYFRRDYEKKEKINFKKKVSSLSFLPETKKLVIGIAIIIVLVFAAYFSYQFSIFLSPPEVTITSPQQTVFRNRDRIVIQGVTEKDATISIFGQEVFADTEGIFEYELPLKEGKNEVVIEVTGANGKKTVVTREYILE